MKQSDNNLEKGCKIPNFALPTGGPKITEIWKGA